MSDDEIREIIDECLDEFLEGKALDDEIDTVDEEEEDDTDREEEI